MFEFLNDIGNYDARKLGRDYINGINISTAYTSDDGYETAILDENGVHPVERYGSKSEAETGHEKWCEQAKTIETVTKLGGFDGLVPDEIITISRNKLKPMETKLTKAEMALLAQSQAPNVYYETGLTPRELLERYREAVEMLEDAALIIDNHEDGHKDIFVDTKDRILALIQKSKQQ